MQMEQLTKRTTQAKDDWLSQGIRLLYLFLLASLPFSIGWDIGGHQIECPSEPLMGLLSGLLLFHFLRKGWWPGSFYRSPIAVASLCFLAWMVIGIPFSSQPMVSAKYSLVALVHWWVFFHGLPLLWRQWPRDAIRHQLVYAVPFFLILLYAWWNHAQYDFRIDVSVLVARPFYFDHALYSCCLSLLVGVLAVGSWSAERLGWRGVDVWICRLLLPAFCLGVYWSYSRAAWLSWMGSLLLVGGMALFKFRFRHVLAMGAVLLLSIALAWPFLQASIVGNEVESKKGSVWEQIISTANVRTDVSNLERLNRYSCAWRMAQDRPLLGFGAGSFQNAYLPYQREEEMTRISVTHSGPHPPGRGGGAHSEYLQALAEMGWPGLVCWLALLLSCLWQALHLNRRLIAWERALLLGVCFGLFTYFLHAFFNNFLHHGKASALFWGLCALLVLMRQPQNNLDL